jgi:hypothetical protein
MEIQAIAQMKKGAACKLRPYSPVGLESVVGQDRPHARLHGVVDVRCAQGLERGQSLHVTIEELIVHHGIVEILQGGHTARLVEVFIRSIECVGVVAAGDVARTRTLGEDDGVIRSLHHAGTDSELEAGIRSARSGQVTRVPTGSRAVQIVPLQPDGRTVDRVRWPVCGTWIATANLEAAHVVAGHRIRAATTGDGIGGDLDFVRRAYEDGQSVCATTTGAAFLRIIPVTTDVGVHEIIPRDVWVPALVAGTSEWHLVGVVIGVHGGTHRQLLEVVHAPGGQRFALGLGEGGQEHAGQDGDDGDHYQQLDEREGSTT